MMHLEFCFYCAKLINEDGFSLAEKLLEWNQLMGKVWAWRGRVCPVQSSYSHDGTPESFNDIRHRKRQDIPRI